MAQQSTYSAPQAVAKTWKKRPSWFERFSVRTSQPHGRVWVLAALLLLLVLATLYHYRVYLPHPDRPHRLTMLDDVFALGVALVVALTGFVLGRRALWPFHLVGFSRLERGALTVGLGWGLLSLGVLALGLAHLLYLWALLALLVGVLLVGWRDVWLVFTWLADTRTYRSLVSKVWPRGFWECTLVCLALVVGVLIGIQWLNPAPWQAYDLYQYHWAVPKLYLLHHAIYALPGWAHANFPFQTEMLNTIALACGVPVAALLIQGGYGLMAMLLLAGYLFRHVGRGAAWLGIALCLCSPLFTSLIIIGYVELALAYSAVATLVLVLAWLRQPHMGRHALRLLLLAGIYSGCGLAAKYTQGQIIIGIGALLLGAVLLNGWRVWRQRGPLDQPRSLLRWSLPGMALYGVGVLVPMLPWLMKDWLLLGNPIYPFIWGGPGWDAARTQVGVVTFAHFGPRGSFWQRLLLGFLGFFFETGRSGEPFVIPMNYLLLVTFAVPLGAIAQRLHAARGRPVLAGVFQSVKAESDLPRLVVPWLVVAGGAYVAWVLSHALVERYALPWLLLLVVPTSVMLLSLLQMLRCWPLVYSSFQGLVLSFLVALGPALGIILTLYTNPFPLLTGQVSLRQWERQQAMDADYALMLDYVHTHIPNDARLLLLGRGEGYFLDEHDYVADSGEDWIPYLETEGRTPAGIIALLQQDGFRYVIYEDRTLNFVIHTYENHYLASFLPAFQRFLDSSLIQVWAYQHFHIYQVPPPAG